MNGHASLNRFYRLVWSQVTQTWHAVSEITKSHGKGGRARGQAVRGVLASVVLGGVSALVHAQQAPPAVNRLPTGGVVAQGTATISQTATAQAAAMAINQSSQRAVINWNSFNVGQNASVTFNQPNAQAVTLNRIADQNSSQIYGQISANGQVYLTNPNGIYFSPTAQVDVGALVATTHGISDSDFMAGNMVFSRNGATGSVVNEGQINAALGGYIALLAPEVRNSGVVVAQAGTVALAAGEVITLNFNNNSLAGLTVTPATLETLIENQQAVRAPGGLVILSAQSVASLQSGVINNSGMVEATTLSQTSDGVIRLEASQSLAQTGTLRASTIAVTTKNLSDTGTWDASAATNGASHGGSIQVAASGDVQQTQAANWTTDGPQGGSILVEALGSANLSGSLSANGTNNTTGGDIAVTAPSVALAGATLSADGDAGGGRIRVGGGWHGTDSSLANASTTTVSAASTLHANALDNGNGGQVVVWSDSLTQDAGSIQAKGGANGGNGGAVEVSSHGLLQWSGPLDVTAARGAAGSVLFDPQNIEIHFYSTNSTTPTVGFSTNPSSTSSLLATDISALLSGGTSVTLQASNDIGVYTAINSTGSGSLTLDAGRSVLIDAAIALHNANLTVIANEWVTPDANGVGGGVINAQRLSGAASISQPGAMGPISTTGDVSFTLRGPDVSGNKTNQSTGAITLSSVSGHNVSVQNNGITSNLVTPLVVASGIVATGDLSVVNTNSGTVELGVTVTGNMSVTNNNGNITQSGGALSVAGVSVLNAGTGTINLPNFLNSFLGGVTSIGSSSIVNGNTPPSGLTSATSGGSATAAQPVVSGTAAAGATVTIYNNGSVLGTATADGNGAWSFQMPAIQSPTVYSIYAVQTWNGVTSATTSVPLVVTASPPSSSSSSSSLGPAPTGLTVTTSGGMATAAQPVLSGMAAAGASVSVRVFSSGHSLVTTGHVTADNTGAWSYQLPSSLSAGSYFLSASQVVNGVPSMSTNPAALSVTVGSSGGSNGSSSSSGSSGGSAPPSTQTNPTTTPSMVAGSLTSSLSTGAGTASPNSNQSVSPTTVTPPSVANTVTPSQIVSISPTQVSSLSAAQVQSISPTALSVLSPQQVAAFTPTQLSSLSATQVQAMTPAQVSSLSPTQVSALNGTQVASLGASQVSALTPAQLGAMRNTQVESLTPSQIGAMSPTQVSALSASQVSSLTATQLQALSDTQLGSLSNTQVASLSVAQAQSLSASQLAALASGNAQAATGGVASTGGASVTSASGAASSLTPAQVSSLSPTQLSSLLTSDTMTPAQVQSLPAATVGSLSLTTLVNLPASAVQSLTATQLQALGPSQARVFNATQGTLLNAEQQAALGVPVTSTSTAASASGTSGTSVGGVGAVGGVASVDVSSLSPAALAAMPASDVAALTTPQVQSLTGAQLTSLSASQLQAINPAQVRNIAPQQLASLSAAQLSDMSSTQVAAMTAPQLASLSPTQVSTLLASGAMTPAQVQSLPAATVSALSEAALSALPASAVQSLSPTQLQAMSPAQAQAVSTASGSAGMANAGGSTSVASTTQASSATSAAGTSTGGVALSTQANVAGASSAAAASGASALTASGGGAASAVKATNNNGTNNNGTGSNVASSNASGSTVAVSTLSASQVAALKPQQLRSLSDTQMSALTTSQVQAFSGRQLAALSATQLQALGSDQVKALSPAQLSSLPIQQVAAFSPAQLSAMSRVQAVALMRSSANLLNDSRSALNPAQKQAVNDVLSASVSSNAATTSASSNGVLPVAVVGAAASGGLGVRFDGKGGSEVKLQMADAPVNTSVSASRVNARYITIEARNASNEKVTFRGAIVGDRLVIAAGSALARQMARTELPSMLSSAIDTLAGGKAIVLDSLKGVVLNVR